jgi:hypothetical protein
MRPSGRSRRPWMLLTGPHGLQMVHRQNQNLQTKIQRLQASQTRKALETVEMLETQVQVSI